MAGQKVTTYPQTRGRVELVFEMQQQIKLFSWSLKAVVGPVT